MSSTPSDLAAKQPELMRDQMQSRLRALRSEREKGQLQILRFRDSNRFSFSPPLFGANDRAVHRKQTETPRCSFNDRNSRMA